MIVVIQANSMMIHAFLITPIDVFQKQLKLMFLIIHHKQMGEQKASFNMLHYFIYF